jgi:hypothetical protein
MVAGNLRPVRVLFNSWSFGGRGRFDCIFQESKDQRALRLDGI